MQQVQEEANFIFQKRKGLSMEKKEARAEREEADKYTALQQELVRPRQWERGTHFYSFIRCLFVMYTCICACPYCCLLLIKTTE